MSWYRFHHDTLDDPVIQGLPAETFKAWVNCLSVASRADDRGTLPDLNGVAFAIRLTPAKAKRHLEILEKAGLIRENSDGTWEITDWNLRQFSSDSSTDRTRKWREKQTSRVTADETSQKRAGDSLDTDTDTDTDPHTDTKRPVGRLADESFQTLLRVYPNKAKRVDAEGAFAELNPDASLVEWMLHAVQVLMESGIWQGERGAFQYAPQLAKWLTDGGWTAVPAPSTSAEPTIYGSDELQKAYEAQGVRPREGVWDFMAEMEKQSEVTVALPCESPEAIEQ